MNNQQREGSGALFTNTRKQNDKHPDMQGDCLINGVLCELAGWWKQSAKGTEFLSISIKPKQQQGGGYQGGGYQGGGQQGGYGRGGGGGYNNQQRGGHQPQGGGYNNRGRGNNPPPPADDGYDGGYDNNGFDGGWE
jgi:hypothetical protein